MKPRNRIDYRIRRHRRIRKKIAGTAARPRLAVQVSNRHMQVQFIDDDLGVTLAAVSTMGRAVPHNVEGAKVLGTEAGAAAVQAGIEHVVVDRGGLSYHGRVKTIVEAAPASGLRTNKQKQPADLTPAGEVESKEDQ